MGRKKFLIVGAVLLSLLLFIILGFLFLQKSLLQPKKQIIQSPTPSTNMSEKTITESKSPISFDILQNPMVYEWRGSVEGTLIAKDENSIIVSDNNQNKITIIVHKGSKEITGGTRFFKNKPTKNPKLNLIDLKDIPLGTKLLGDFFVFPHKKTELVGSSFEVLEK